MTVSGRHVLFLNAWGDSRGGAQRSVRSWMDVLAARGHRVSLACPDGEWADDARHAGYGWEWLPRDPWALAALEQASPPNLLRLLAILRRLRPDLIHTVQYGSHLLARVASALTGVPWVHTVLGPLSPGHRFAGGPYLAVSRAFERDARAAGADDVRLCPARLDLTAFTPRPHPRESSAPAVTFASRLDGRLEAVATLVCEALLPLARAGVRCQVAGDGDALPRLRERYGRDLVFLGHRPDLAAVLWESDVLIGAGRTLIEGLACGVPCVSVGQRGSGGVVAPDAVDAIAEHNFGGRHVPSARAPDPAVLTRDVSGLLDDAEARAALTTWGPTMARQYDARLAGPVLEEAYDAACRERQSPLRSVWLLACLTGDKAARSLLRASGRASRPRPASSAASAAPRPG